VSTTDRDRLVSVVMIFRNALEFFDEAIRSVLAQTQRVELLLCDDGSGDGSTEFARKWATREPGRVKYLDHPGHAHRGMSATRNLGIRAATGDFIAFLDADDVWAPNHLSHEVSILERHPDAGMVCGQALEWHSWTEDREADVWTPLPWPPGTVVPVPHMLTATLRRGDFRTPTCSLLVRRDLLRSVAGAEERFTAMFEDQALLAKLHTTAPAVISGTRTAYYRQHSQSSVARAVRAGTYRRGAPSRSRERFLRWLEDYLSGHPCGRDDALRAAVTSALVPYNSRMTRLRSHLRFRFVPRDTRVLGLLTRVGRRLPVRLGSLRRLTPVSRHFGYDRGLPVDRYYIERFLQDNAHLISGRVLEVGDAAYSRRFGGDRVTHFDVLNIKPGHPDTTFVGDLAEGHVLPSDAFDCVILTQTLHLIYDLPAAVRTLNRALRPGGSLLATFPGISPISSDEWASTWYWALTPVSARRLFGEAFGEEHIEVTAHGNVLTSTAFLQGMAANELRSRELGVTDPQFPMLITVRAGRAADEAVPPRK
jgi:glycosyltransferase involved in cell wall biosynthesis